MKIRELGNKTIRNNDEVSKACEKQEEDGREKEREKKIERKIHKQMDIERY